MCINFPFLNKSKFEKTLTYLDKIIIISYNKLYDR